MKEYDPMTMVESLYHREWRESMICHEELMVKKMSEFFNLAPTVPMPLLKTRYFHSIQVSLNSKRVQIFPNWHRDA
ncbi:hypothetical protein [Nostoc sp. UIC 10630]|uniref:hypothetical protein n=1 Tax=Nostoc sp. UIC 10630 TaxID=2100146 RepID=UPI0013D809CB|nr:hypothetical protein [Nostoc sp. UIC 10630]NEU80704.1 hypothetical protein [Nostoc sp. UIC 10630]